MNEQADDPGPYVFVSYASADRELVMHVVAALQSAGVHVWMDQNDIRGGAIYGSEIAAGIEQSSALVLMCSDVSLTSRNVVQEIMLAWKYQRPFLPLLLEPTVFPQDVEYWLEGAQWIEVYDYPQGEWLPRCLRALARLGAIDAATTDAPVTTSAGSKRRAIDASPSTNLQVPMTRFIGRQQDMDEIQAILEECRLVTLMGSGGVGKSRLATEIGRDRLGRYVDGVWLVELGSLRVGSLIPHEIATVLGVKEEPGTSIWETLQEYLRSRHLLLILDTCEHLISDVALIAEKLLGQYPGVSILTTTREPLRIEGERPFLVSPLSVPEEIDGPDAGKIVHSEAVQLFIDRAQAARPDISLTDISAPTIARICRRLDGIPLALELAAARTRALSLEQLSDRLDDRFRILGGGNRSALPRHQTLRATIDWSYNLLTEPEQILLNRLSVFAGGCTLESAEAICSDECIDQVEIIDLLITLIDKSLVSVVEVDGQARYYLLDTIREYAEEKSVHSGDDSAMRLQHAAYFHHVSEDASIGLRGPERNVWLNRLKVEQENFRAILAQGGTTDELTELAAKVAGHLTWYWHHRRLLSEGRAWLESSLAWTGLSAETRARCLFGAGAMATAQADYDAANAYTSESIKLSRETGQDWDLAIALSGKANIANTLGNYEEMQTLAHESIAHFRKTGDPWGLAVPFGLLGRLAMQTEDYRVAKELYEEALRLRRNVGDVWLIAQALINLGDVARCERDFAGAEAYYEEALQLFRQVNYQDGIASALHNLGHTQRNQGWYERGAQLFFESFDLSQTVGDLRGQAECLIGLAGCLWDAGEPELAARTLSFAQGLLKSVNAVIWPTNRVDYECIVNSICEDANAADLSEPASWGATAQLDDLIAEIRPIWFPKV